MATANAHGLFLPGGWRYVCPGRALVGTANGHGSWNFGPPYQSFTAVTWFTNGPEGPGPYISIRDVTPYAVAYEICNATLGSDPYTGNSHDTVGGGTLLPSTSSCVAQSGL
jgi:hypothetical protein